jgi:hypothetical protein
MYLTVFAAFRLYGLLEPLPAFALMIIVCGLSCALALLQNSRALAVAAFAGGFAVPLLLSTGQGSHVGLFSYYTLLNLAILFIAYKRSWRILNVVGFIATFGVATAWGVLKYTRALRQRPAFPHRLCADLPVHRHPVCAQHADPAGQRGRHHAGLRHAAGGLWPAGRAGARHGAGHGLFGAGLCRALPVDGHGAGAPRAGQLPPAD